MILISAATGVLAGNWYGRKEMRPLVLAHDRLEGTLENAEARAERLTRELSEVRLGCGVSSGAMAALRENLNTCRLEVAALQSQVAHYRQVVAPGKATSGVQISEFRIVRTLAAESFNFELRLAQDGAGGLPVRGTLEVVLEADAGGQKVLLPLDRLQTGVSYPIRVGFTHFQHVSGVIKVPSRHTPMRVLVTLEPAEKGGKALARSFPWIVESV